MKKKAYKKGDVIFRQGDVGSSFFRIEKGAVEVFAAGPDGEEKKLTELGAGDFIGEMAVVETYPRSATVIVSEDGTKITEVNADDLNAYFTEEPDKIIELFRHIGGRLRSLTDDYKAAAAELDQMTGAGKEKEGLAGRIGKMFSGLFGHKEPALSEESSQVLKGYDFSSGYSGEVKKYRNGTVIFREGEPGRCMYAIHWGRVGIYTDYGTPAQQLLAELNPGQFFGEMGMIENEPRSATAVVTEPDTKLEIITPDGLQVLFEKNPGKVDEILRMLSYRLRKLTKDYVSTCEQINALKKA